MEKLILPFRVSISEKERKVILARFEEILLSGRLVLGKHTKEFEKNFAEEVGTRYAIAVNSGSSALEIIFRALRIEGQEVLVPTNTNYATAMAVIQAGGTLAVYDSGLYPSLPSLESMVTPQTAALVVVHIGGYISPDIFEISRLCRERGIALIEDAAHAHGSSLDGTSAGTFGEAAAFSFYPTKVLTTGEGGMITTNNKHLSDVAVRLRDQGKGDDNRYHVLNGNSWRITEFGAALGNILLRSLAEDIEYRMALIEQYSSLCAVLSYEAKQAVKVLTPVAGQMLSGYKLFGLLTPSIDRGIFRDEMKRHGVILARGTYEIPLHKQPIFQNLKQGSFPMADSFCNNHIAFPLWRHMLAEEVKTVVECIPNVISAIGKIPTNVHSVPDVVNLPNDIRSDRYPNPEEDLLCAMARAYIAAKGGSIIPPPVMDIHFGSSVCNLDCRWCVGRQGRKKYKPLPVAITKDSVSNILGLILTPSLQHLWPGEFHIAGADSEPLLSSAVLPAIQYLMDKGRIIQVTTNGAVSMPDLLVDALAQIKYLNFSVDVISEEHYSKFKLQSGNVYKNTLGLVLKNIERIIQRKSALNTNTIIAVSFVATHHTYEYESWVQFFIKLREMGVDRIRIRQDVIDTFGKWLGDIEADIRNMRVDVPGIEITYESPSQHYTEFEFCRSARLWPVLGVDGCLYDCGHLATSLYKPFVNLLNEKSLIDAYGKIFSPPNHAFRRVDEIGCNRQCPPFLGRFNDLALLKDTARLDIMKILGVSPQCHIGN